jgi:O-antigen/teichoic acid export membrane protein
MNAGNPSAGNATDDGLPRGETPGSAVVLPSTANPGFAFKRLAGVVRRHSLSAFGPLSISGAHFVAALLLLHTLPSAEFGQFSFVIVVASLCLSVTNGLLGAPITCMVPSETDEYKSELNIYLKVSLVLALVLSCAVGSIMLFSHTPAWAAAYFGLYGGAMSLRIFARTHAYTLRRVRAVILSDTAYSASLLLGLGGLMAWHQLNIFSTAVVMAVGALLALAPFGTSFLSKLAGAIRAGSIRAYRRIWQDLTRWSLLGVVTTEATVNAHAYLVTFISGSKAFALIAAGSLFMRPFSLVVAALPDQERPAMARSIAAGDMDRAFQVGREFLAVIGAIWAATTILAAVVLIWFPFLILKKGFAKTDLICVVVLWALITAVRGIRAPGATLLQAAGQFRPLADASTKSSIVALIATLALLLLVGPVGSLGGILLGDVVMWMVIASGLRTWKASRA